jgi:cupin fold WbuC family metalloprotein
MYNFNDMNIDQTLLDNLSAQAKASPRLRMNMDLRDSAEDQSQRMLNALEPGTVLPIHRHRKTSETVAILRGRAVQYLYDDEGNETDAVLLEAGGEVPAMQVEMGQWHRLESLESGTVIVEFKNGAYEPIGPEDIL